MFMDDCLFCGSFSVAWSRKHFQFLTTILLLPVSNMYVIHISHCGSKTSNLAWHGKLCVVSGFSGLGICSDNNETAQRMNNTHYKGNYRHSHSQKKKKSFAARVCKLYFCKMLCILYCLLKRRDLELCRRRVPLIWIKYSIRNDEIQRPKQDISMNRT